MGSLNFNLGKLFLTALCLGAFAWWYSGFSFAQIASDFDQAARSFLNDDVGLSFQYSDEGGARFSSYRTYVINGMTLKLETVDDEEGIRQGLSDRASMNEDEGLLFIMPTTDIHPFWMNRMRFPIDMIWLRDGVVVEIAPNMQPPSMTGGIPATHIPKEMADQVLELTAGGADRYWIKVGDKLDF